MSAATPLPEIASGLYVIAVTPDPAASGSPAPSTVFAYYLTRDDPPPDQSVTLDTVWTDAGLVGWYIFVGDPIAIETAPGFAAAARATLPPFQAGTISPRTLVWLSAPDPTTLVASLPLYQPGTATRRTPVLRRQGAYAFSWAPLSLTIDSGVAVAFDAEALTLTLGTDIGNRTLIGLVSAGRLSDWYDWYAEDGSTWAIVLPLTGAAPGAFGTRLGLDFGVLIADFACGLNYVRQQGDALDGFAYPFYPPRAVGAAKPGFLIGLHPLRATDESCTRLALDLGDGSPVNRFQETAAGLRAEPFLTTTGGAITLAPAAGVEEASGYGPAGPGFAFCIAPTPATSPVTTEFYLAPVGTYRVDAIAEPGGSPAPDVPARWMCGLTGLEYLDIATGDHIALQAAMPARMVAGSDGAQGLDDAFTTSWIRYPLTGATRRYFGQPSASVYFGTVATGDFARPVEALLAELDAPALFPLAPYGAFTAAAGTMGAENIAAFEGRAIAGARHARLTADSPGPVFQGMTRFGATAESGGSATAETKQGFVVGLNPDGTWRAVDFARSPDDMGQYLGLRGEGSPPLIGKDIATQLLRDDLFLVVSDAMALGRFEREIALAGFTFLLDVGTRSPVGDQSTILIFKYNTTTALRELATSRGAWAAADVFVADPEGTRRQIVDALAEAEAPARPDDRAFQAGGGASPSEADPFANFRAIVDDPKWTGVLALNCAIDGNAMPADLQMLLGGINGQLRAHHFGIESNKLDVVAGEATITRSSLFGLISYPSGTLPVPPPDTKHDFAYELELLTVLFQNSTIQDMKARVGLTVNRLFGREVVLVSGPTSHRPLSPHNTIEITGRYQIQDGIAVVTFVSDQPFFFAFPIPEGSSRVLRQVAFDRAALVPISSEAIGSPTPGSPATTEVKAHFALSGALWFHAAPFRQAPPGFDLFSFGTEPPSVLANGLAMSGFAVDIAFALDATGGIVGGRKVTGNLSAAAFTASRSAIRRDSLLDNLPLQLSKFISSDQGFTAASLGASPVHVLDLEPPLAGGSPHHGSPAPSGTATPPPNVTLAPQFGLEFDMPLGSLGVLSNATVGLMAKLVIGWGPSRLVPETDAAAVLVQLPQVFAGYGSFQLQGILKTVFGDANLLMVERKDGSSVYAVLFNNVQLSILGKSFPSGLVIDFLIFAGRPAADPADASRGDSNLAWFLGATGAAHSPPGAP